MSVTIEDKNARAKVGAGAEGQRRKREALAVCIENIKSDTYEYVPYATGNLRDITVDTSNGEEGIISWNAPYAAYVYNMKGVNWTTDGTCGKWVEAAKNAGGKERWQKIIYEVMNG